MTLINPTLNYVAQNYLNATNGLPSSLTFTRATTATYVNAIGQIASAASGALRHDYDPVTGEYKGWLIEEARTNLCLQSADFATSWTAYNSSVSANAATAPDGATTADKVVEAANTNNHGPFQVVTATASTVHTWSVFAKADTRRYLKLVIDDVGGTNAVSAVFDLQAGAITQAAAATGTGSAPTAQIKDYGNGWYRCSVSGAPAASGASVRGSAFMSTSATPGATFSTPYAGDGTSGLYLWGAQLEAGAFATSYIPTTTASITRNADVLSIATSSITAGGGAGFNPNEGTLFLTFSKASVAGSACVAGINSSGSATLLFWTNGTTLTARMDNTTQQSNQSTTIAANTVYKAAVGYAVNNTNAAFNGVLGTNDTSCSIPSMTTLSLGGTGLISGVNGCDTQHLRHVAYFPRRLSDADLQTITT